METLSGITFFTSYQYLHFSWNQLKMAPKKAKRTGVATKSGASKSTGLDYEYDPLTTKKEVETPKMETPAVATAVKSKFPDEDMEAEVGIVRFMSNYADNNMTVRHLFQVLLILFLANLLYLWYTEKHAEWLEGGYVGKDPMDSVIVATCILMVAVMELFAIANASLKAWKKKITKATQSNMEPEALQERYLELAKQKPELPSFNYLFSISLPLGLTLLLAPQYLIFVGVCVVQISEMHVIVRAMLSYVIIFQFAGMTGDSTIAAVASSVTNDITTSSYLTVPLICTFQHEMFNRLVGKAIEPYERTFIITASTFLMTVPTYGLADDTIVVMRGLFTALVVAIYFSLGFNWLRNKQINASAKILLILLTYATFIGTFVVVSHKLLFPIFGMSPLHWVTAFISESAYRLTVFKVWVLSSLVIVPLGLTLVAKFVSSVDVKRKLWHFVLFFMVISPMVQDPQLVSVALFGIGGILIVVELLRANNIPPFGAKIAALFASFLDSKDQGEWVTSYIYLVLGVGAPLWMTNLDITRETSYLGLITLGFGDSLASLVGRRFGATKWPSSEKSMEGSLAFVVGSIIGFGIVDFFVATQGIELMGCNWINRIVVIILVAGFEGFVTVNDNLFVPVFASFAEESLLKFT